MSAVRDSDPAAGLAPSWLSEKIRVIRAFFGPPKFRTPNWRVVLRRLYCATVGHKWWPVNVLPNDTRFRCYRKFTAWGDTCGSYGRLEEDGRIAVVHRWWPPQDKPTESEFAEMQQRFESDLKKEPDEPIEYPGLNESWKGGVRKMEPGLLRVVAPELRIIGRSGPDLPWRPGLWVQYAYHADGEKADRTFPVYETTKDWLDYMSENWNSGRYIAWEPK